MANVLPQPKPKTKCCKKSPVAVSSLSFFVCCFIICSSNFQYFVHRYNYVPQWCEIACFYLQHKSFQGEGLQNPPLNTYTEVLWKPREDTILLQSPLCCTAVFLQWPWTDKPNTGTRVRQGVFSWWKSANCLMPLNSTH